MDSLPFRLCLRAALALGAAQAFLAEEVQTIAREDPLWISWLTGLVVFLLWLPARALFAVTLGLALWTPEGRRHQAGERRAGRG